MQKNTNIVYELNQEQHIQSDCRINDIFVNSNSNILIISKSLQKQSIVTLNLYQFKEGWIKQFQNYCHSQKGIYSTPNSNIYITQHAYDYEMIMKNQSFVGLNNSKYLNLIRFNHYHLSKGMKNSNIVNYNYKNLYSPSTHSNEIILTMNDQEDQFIYSYNIKMVKMPQTFKAMRKLIQKSAIIFNKKQKGAWVQYQKIADDYSVQDMFISNSTQELICSCTEQKQTKSFINIFKQKNGQKWSITKTLKIPLSSNILYSINQKNLAVFNNYLYDLILYQLQEDSGWFKKFKSIKIMEPEGQKYGETIILSNKGQICFSDSLQLHIIYNQTSIIIIDLETEGDQIVQKIIDIEKSNFDGCSKMTQNGKYYIVALEKSQKMKIFKIYNDSIKNK